MLRESEKVVVSSYTQPSTQGKHGEIFSKSNSRSQKEKYQRGKVSNGTKMKKLWKHKKVQKEQAQYAANGKVRTKVSKGTGAVRSK